MEIKNYVLEPMLRNVIAKSNKDELFLSIKIGNGQIGGNKVSLGGKVIAKGNLSEPTYIGSSDSLVDKVLEVETNVLDVNGFTNKCVVTVSFLNQNNEDLYSNIDKGDAPENGVASFKSKYIVKYMSVFVFLLCCLYQNGYTQSSADKLEFNNLETPTSPGLILFDQTPSSIEKPTTPQGLGLNLLSLSQNGGSLEFSPFWLKDHPNLTAKNMYNNKMPILAHLGVSVATITSDTLSFISGGIRTRILQLYGQNIKDLDAAENNIVEALSDGDFVKVDSLRKVYVEIIERPIFNIDFAGALGASSTNNSYNELEISRWAAWLTFNFRPKGDDFYLTLLTRYINTEKYDGIAIRADLVDLGTRLNYDISRFTVSLEYIHRMNITSEIFNDYRLAFIGSYKLSDNVFVTSTFGKNFSDVNNIIAIAGLNFGFSQKKVKAF